MSSFNDSKYIEFRLPETKVNKKNKKEYFSYRILFKYKRMLDVE